MFVAQIGFQGSNYFIGKYINEEEAGQAYDLKAIELHGEFARLNFPKLKEEYLKQLKYGTIR